MNRQLTVREICLSLPTEKMFDLISNQENATLKRRMPRFHLEQRQKGWWNTGPPRCLHPPPWIHRVTQQGDIEVTGGIKGANQLT